MGAGGVCGRIAGGGGVGGRGGIAGLLVTTCRVGVECKAWEGRATRVTAGVVGAPGRANCAGTSCSPLRNLGPTLRRTDRGYRYLYQMPNAGEEK